MRKFNWKHAGYGLLYGFAVIAICAAILGYLSLLVSIFGFDGAMIAYVITFVIAAIIFAGFYCGGKDEPEV